MSQYLILHPVDPEPRLLKRIAEVVRAGGLIVYPTDSTYALGCHLGDKGAVERMRAIRQVDARHLFALACRDLAEIATYARVDNSQYRLLRAVTPGCYTFILQATREVPKRLQHPSRKTIGLRVPDHRIVRALLEALGEPLLTSTLLLPGDDAPLSDMDEIRKRLGHDVDLIVDGGPCGIEMTTVVNLTSEVPVVVREGKGSLAPFGL